MIIELENPLQRTEFNFAIGVYEGKCYEQDFVVTRCHTFHVSQVRNQPISPQE